MVIGIFGFIFIWVIYELLREVITYDGIDGNKEGK